MGKMLDDDKARDRRAKILCAFLMFASEIEEPVPGPVVMPEHLIESLTAYNVASATYYGSETEDTQEKFDQEFEAVRIATQGFSNVWTTKSGHEVPLNEERYTFPQKELFRAVSRSVPESSPQLIVAGKAFIDALEAFNPVSKYLPAEIRQAVIEADKAFMEALTKNP